MSSFSISAPRVVNWGLVLALLLLLPSSLAVVFADFSLPDWRYQKEITLPDGRPDAPLSGGLAELRVDTEVFGGASPGLADLRLFGQRG